MKNERLLLDLRGKKALVTGGSRGIGAATVKLLAATGADVVLGYRTRSIEAEGVADAARSAGVQAVAFAADVSTQSGADALATKAVNELGRLDLFIGNAGIWPADDIALTEMDDAQWHRTIRQNLDSIFFTMRAATRVISEGGSMVLVSSTAGQRGEAYHADYAATKGAVISFTKSLAIELASRGVNVNCVAPGWVETNMVESAIAEAGLERITANIPLGRIASAEDVAGPIVFLCSSLARHITGEVLNINGGSVLSG